MSLTDKKVFFEDCVFLTTQNVYEPAEDSFLFAENLEVSDSDVVLDIGTGCGILGIIAAKRSTKVVAIDINPHAVLCAKENAKLNSVQHNFSLIQGDLLTPLRIDQKFELILFNAPYLPSTLVDSHSYLELAWNGGATGRQVIDRFIKSVSPHLKKNGKILLMQSTLAGVEATKCCLEENDLTAFCFIKRDLPFFETIVLIKAKKN